MKKFTNIFIAIVLTTVLLGCKKKLFDYRNNYLGEYQITYHYSYWKMGNITGDTTINYIGQINYGDKGNIKIDWYDGTEYEFTVSKYGTITKCLSKLGTINKKNFELSFTDDLCGPGPLGANYTITLTGNKQ
ncbi:MAG: hypothetical protein M9916_09485 [Crocinitomicaceae bacterium]|nr:hypothetical protein [Crocinitomicaceae bacterium]